MSNDLTLVKILPYLEQAHALFSFTGKVFYSTKIIHPSEGEPWATVEFVPAERYGTYNLEPETQRRYCVEYGQTSADPTCGPALYPYYHVLVDTGIIVVRGVIRYYEVACRDPAHPEINAIGRICDVTNPEHL